MEIPSGHVKIAIENVILEWVFPGKNWFCLVMFVYQRVLFWKPPKKGQSKQKNEGLGWFALHFLAIYGWILLWKLASNSNFQAWTKMIWFLGAPLVRNKWLNMRSELVKLRLICWVYDRFRWNAFIRATCITSGNLLHGYWINKWFTYQNGGSFHSSL